MKKKARNRPPSHSGPGVPPTRFELIQPGACEVLLAGSFYDWHPAACPLIHPGEGRWAKELALPPGHYEYRFVVDGEWMADPAAAEGVPNGCGGVNSVLVVPNRAA